MLCERCKKRDATIHLAEIIKDVKSELHLCEHCAREMGLNTKISNFSITIPEMLTFLDIDELNYIQNKNRCPLCGLDFIDYKRNGKLGCPECYIHLEEQIEALLLTLHGEERYCGKFPKNFKSERNIIIQDESKKGKIALPDEITELDRLRMELQEAVADERYEDAAVLRDRIKELGGTFTR